MKHVEIYTTPLCGYCRAAKQLLKSKAVPFAQIDVMFNPGKKTEMIKRANGGSTVPQIFIGGDHIGGCDELHLLERQGTLDRMLAGLPAGLPDR